VRLPADNAQVRIAPGTRQDLRALAPLHYRAGPPRAIARDRRGRPAILAARDGAGRLAGVLCVCMPPLNARWRSLAWPDDPAPADRREAAARCNALVRRIARVIVAPAHRAQGVARSLVQAYLRHPLTPRTEALASMGPVCPFFEAAGMVAYPLPPSRRDARLLDALFAAGLEPCALLAPGRALEALADHPFLEREARLWANASVATRRHVGAAAHELLALGACRASQRPVAYAHGA
jgi:GNAT superfamily N-acetyltransferase